MTPSTESIPYGFCHCGCGQHTLLTKGIPRKFIAGHWNRIHPTIEYAAPFKIDGEYCRLIPLTQGQYAIVWEADYYWLMQWKWSALWSKSVRSFYAVRNSSYVDGKRTVIRMHREILSLQYRDGVDTDHVDTGNTLDNRRSNLRPATRGQNVANGRKRCDNSSGFKGVSYHPSRGTWQVRIMVDGRRVTVGYYKTKEEAYEAYCTAALKHYGKFARFS